MPAGVCSGDPGAVGRPLRGSLWARQRRRRLHRAIAIALLHEELARLGPAGDVGQHLPVGRDGRVELEAGVEGELLGLARHQRALSRSRPAEQRGSGREGGSHDHGGDPRPAAAAP